MAVDEPIEFGTDAEEAFGFVRTLGIVDGPTQNLSDGDKANALDGPAMKSASGATSFVD